MMWTYWRDKRGSPSLALEADYPELAKSDQQLALALAQIKNAELVIDTIMTKREDDEE